MDVARLLEIEREENAALRERIAQLEKLQGIRGYRAPLEFNLSGSEEMVLGVLLAAEIATKDHIMAALYRDFAKDEAEIKIIDVFICKVRKKLRPFGIEIRTDWGQGYFMTPEMKQRVRGMSPRAAAGAVVTDQARLG